MNTSGFTSTRIEPETSFYSSYSTIQERPPAVPGVYMSKQSRLRGLFVAGASDDLWEGASIEPASTAWSTSQPKWTSTKPSMQPLTCKPTSQSVLQQVSLQNRRKLQPPVSPIPSSPSKLCWPPRLIQS